MRTYFSTFRLSRLGSTLFERPSYDSFITLDLVILQQNRLVEGIFAQVQLPLYAAMSSTNVMLLNETSFKQFQKNMILKEKSKSAIGV